MSKKINRQLIQDILAKGEGTKTVSSEAVDWVIGYAEEMAKRMAKDGRRSPGGRLMGFNMEPSVAASVDFRQVEKQIVLGTGFGSGANAPGLDPAPAEEAVGKWSEYHEWQAERRSGRTKLPFEEWKEQRK